MKRYLTFTLILATTVLAWMAFSDAFPGGGPTKVAKHFLEAYEAADWETAKMYSTEETQKALDEIATLSKGPTNREIYILREEMNDQVGALVYYSLDGGEEKKLTLINSEGKWLVASTKIELPGYNDGMDMETWIAKEVDKGIGAKTTQKFLELVEAGEYEKAKAYGSPSVEAYLVSMIEGKAAPLNRKFTILKEQILTEEKSGAQKRQVHYQFKGEEMSKIATLTEVNGEWKVSISKSDLHPSLEMNMEGLDENMPEEKSDN